MKFSANLTLLYREHDFLDRFQAAAEDGFKGIEIQFPYDVPAEQIRQKLDEFDLECVLFNVPAGDLMQGGEGLAAVPERVQEFNAALDMCLAYAQIITPRCINLLAGRCMDDNKRQECMAQFIRNLARVEERLAPLGITPTFEAINQYDMPSSLISSFADMQQVLARMKLHTIKMQFDIYHMAMMSEPVEGLLKEYSNQIGHIQFADAPGRHEPGSGAIDFSSVFKAISESNYQGWVGAEYRPALASTSAGLDWMKGSCLD